MIAGHILMFKVKGKTKPVNMTDPTKALDLSVAAYAKLTHKDDIGKLHVKIEFLSKTDGEDKYKRQMERTDPKQNKIRVDAIKHLFKLDEKK